jgi:hypothetical protein
MTTTTLTGNTNSSALSLANGDTIDCAGFRLTLNAQPSATNISVVSPGTAGRVTISGAYDLSTWNFTPGTGTLIDGSIPSGCTVGTVNGGSTNNAQGCNTNNGTITNVNGGSANTTAGVLNSFGVITNCTGGTGAAATVGVGCGNNYGLITNSTGAKAVGCNFNGGTITNAIGSSSFSVAGVGTNSGIVLNLDDNTGDAIGTFYGTVFLCLGPGVLGKIKAPIATIYSLGKMSTSATLPAGSTVIELSQGSGGFTGILGLGRGVGT